MKATVAFIQPQTWLKTWTRADWRRELALAKGLGIRTLVIQWAVHDGTSFVPTTETEPDLIRDVLNVAEDEGLEVILGTLAENQWFREHASNTYRTEYRQRHRELMTRLRARYGGHPVMRGWYIPLELHDEGMLTNGPNAAFDMATFVLALLGDMNAGARPGERMNATWVSAFYTGTVAVEPMREAFGRFFQALGEASPHLFVQDGFGARTWSDPESVARPRLAALAEICRARPRLTCHAVIEAFEHEAGAPPDVFRAAWVERLQKQLALSTPLFDGLAYFDWPHYLSPAKGPRQKALYEALAKATH
jgi:hypothetical protein